LAGPANALARQTAALERSQAGAIQCVDRRIQPVGNDRAGCDDALSRIRLVLERCQLPFTPSGCPRDAQDFLKCRLAGADFDKPIFIECAKTSRPGLLFDHALILASPADCFADAVVDDE